MSTFSLDDFIKTHWKKTPATFTVPSSPVAPEHLMLVLARVFERLTNPETMEAAATKLVRFYVDGRQIAAPEYAAFLPTGGSVDEYSATLTERLKGARFGIVINDAHSLLPEAWPAVLAFTAPLIERVGIPAKNVETAIFIGTYAATPFGIHRDLGNSVFTFPVIGRKKFLLWPPDHFAADLLQIYLNPDPSQYVSTATTLVVEPGELSYWPEDWMHVGWDPEAKLHAAFSIGTWSEAQQATQMSELIQSILEKKLPPSYRTEWPSTAELPNELNEAATLLEEAFRTGEFRRALEEQWSRRRERAGFRT